jgi:hypothetical protein
MSNDGELCLYCCCVKDDAILGDDNPLMVLMRALQLDNGWQLVLYAAKHTHLVLLMILMTA